MSKNFAPGLVIDSDKPPKEFKGYGIYKHVPCGKILYNPLMFEFFFTKKQLLTPTIATLGEEHYRSIMGVKGLVNGNFLDFFMKYPDKIPKIMKGSDLQCNQFYTLFTKTVYEHLLTGELCIRYLRFFSGKPEAHFLEINGEFGFPSYYPSLRLSN